MGTPSNRSDHIDPCGTPLAIPLSSGIPASLP